MLLPNYFLSRNEKERQNIPLCQELGFFITDFTNEVEQGRLSSAIEGKIADLFDLYMRHPELTFGRDSIQRLKVYHNFLQEHPGFLSHSSHHTFSDLVEAQVVMWENVQAPIYELVSAGKSGLLQHNGKATFDAFQQNTFDAPEAFQPVMAMVRDYLKSELSGLMIGLEAKGLLDFSHNEQDLHVSLHRGFVEDFAKHVFRNHLWSPKGSFKNPVLESLKVSAEIDHLIHKPEAPLSA